jgi:D-alanyl-lipoteichoic acid acyltransferase DltB (MBOAT superfamily)
LSEPKLDGGVRATAAPAESRTKSARLSAAPNPKIDLAAFVAISGVLALLFLLLYVYRIEALRGFARLLPLLFGGFLVHAWLPRRARAPFFLALSVGAIVLVIGVPAALRLIGVGVVFVGLCHLPIPFRLRIAAIVAAGGLLAYRWGFSQQLSENARVVLPLFGSMFMFRLALYLYDLRYKKAKVGIAERLGYFFMAPNVCFPLFPVVDFATWRRSAYDTDARAIYEKGLAWILRGTTHLILYRYVYYYLSPAPSEVRDLPGVVLSVVSSYLLYLRISGQFHLIIGILCLFGWNLPETHHRYFLASDVSDFWRRINIYWKDFVMKLFFYPLSMRLARRGMSVALVGGTLGVFAVSWLLHSYQWFWLRGTFPISATDALFWGILGALVAVNSLRQARQSSRRGARAAGASAGAGADASSRGGAGARATATSQSTRLSATQSSATRTSSVTVSSAFHHALRVLGMFLLISLLWSLWSAPSVADWLAMLAAGAHTTPAQVAGLLLLAAAAVGVGTFVQLAASGRWPRLATLRAPDLARSPALAGVAALALLALAQPAVHERLGPRVSEVAAALRENKFNQREKALREQGYYEELIGVEKYTSNLWEVEPAQPPDWISLIDTEIVRMTEDMQWYELLPSYEISLKEGRFGTNRWGMRDRDYELQKPAGTLRLALIGSSYVLGSGVNNEETFETITEDRLNGEAGGRWELMNFGHAGFSPLEMARLADKRVFQFAPDAVLYFAHANDERRAADSFVRDVMDGVSFPYPRLARIVEETGVSSATPPSEVARLVMPHSAEILAWCYDTIAERCRETGAIPVWIYMPRTEEVRRDAASSAVEEAARRAGFVIWSLDGVFGSEGRDVRLADWDEHPNARGHEMIAEHFHDLLKREEAVLR